MIKPPRQIFFVDRALGKSVPEALRQAGARVEVHGDHFAADAPDTEWLPAVSRLGWIVLTKDAAIGRNPLEIQAITRANAKVFILVSGNLQRSRMAAIFVEKLQYMERFSQSNSAPFIVKLYKYGRAILWRNHTQLLKLV